jgi:hypothetical protein
MPKGWPHIESKTDAEKEAETRPQVGPVGDKIGSTRPPLSKVSPG